MSSKEGCLERFQGWTKMATGIILASTLKRMSDCYLSKDHFFKWPHLDNQK